MITRVGLGGAGVSIIVDGHEVAAMAGAQLEIETEMLDVSSWRKTHEPDPAWSFTDDAGHFHAWASDKGLPTLRLERREAQAWCETCREYHDGLESWRCYLCGEVVEPETRVADPQPPSQIEGRRSWRIIDLRTEGLGTWAAHRQSVSVLLNLGAIGQRFGRAIVGDITLSSWSANIEVATVELVGDGPLSERLPGWSAPVATEVGNDVARVD